MAKESELTVAIHSPYPLREGPNGVSNFVLEIEPYLKREGCSVRLIGPSLKSENAAHFTLGRPFKIPLGGTEAEITGTFNKGRARNTLLTIKPDILVVHEPVAGNGAHTLISSAPKRQDGSTLPAVIGHFHAQIEKVTFAQKLIRTALKASRRPRFSNYGIPTGKFTSGYADNIIRNMDGRIAVSNATARFYRDFYKDERHVEVIPNGINIDRLTPKGPKIGRWQEDGKKTILFAGRHDPRKGIEYLLQAYALLKQSGKDNIKLKITGEGQETQNLKQLTSYLNVSDVQFLGVLPREELIKAYRSADLFVSPAIGGEGFGRTLAEALACGTLVVGSDINGYREVIGGQSFARMAKPENAHDLSLKIWEFLSLPDEERQKLEEQASLYVMRRFAWPVVARQTVNYYHEVLERHGKPEKEEWPLKRQGIIFQRK